MKLNLSLFKLKLKSITLKRRPAIFKLTSTILKLKSIVSKLKLTILKPKNEAKLATVQAKIDRVDNFDAKFASNISIHRSCCGRAVPAARVWLQLFSLRRPWLPPHQGVGY